MAGKQVIDVDAKSVINFKSNFSHKLLCDGLTFADSSSCVFSCAFCYVEDLMRKNPHKIPNPEDHQRIVIRRKNALQIVRNQLTRKNGQPRFADPADRRVIYSSPLADVAANKVLVEDTIEICKAILELTHWQIRLLSKSVLLKRVAEALAPYRDRMIYGLSTGTLNDELAGSFERGTAMVSRRIEVLKWLQDNGFRTFAMVCPSLPLENDQAYDRFAEDCARELRTDRCEHVWAEVLNVRGESMIRTCAALRAAGFSDYAERVELVSTNKSEWERYARLTFEAHARVHAGQPGKLRFLQYVSKATREYWQSKAGEGAILL